MIIPIIIDLAAHTVSAVCDLLALLLFVRLLSRWRPKGLCWELDLAGTPLLDRLLRNVRRLWRWAFPVRPLGPAREIGVALIIVGVVRLSLGFGLFIR